MAPEPLPERRGRFGKGLNMTLRKLLLAATFASGVAIASAAHADIKVFTGYADNLRPSGFFPTIWLGDAGVVSESSAAQSFDAGAIRIENDGASAITIDNFKVTMNGGGGPTLAIWSSLVIGAGENGIFTQTVSFNFDTSDFSPNGGSPPGGIFPLDPGGNGIGGCSSTAAAQTLAGILAVCAAEAPIVEFDIGADHFTLSDTGHILDTGWYDFVAQSPDGN